MAACISAVRLAFAFREEFGHDVVLDLIGYRRFGHNEADEPAYTQPEMYEAIKPKKRVAELFAERLVEQGVVTQDEVERQRQEVWDQLTRAAPGPQGADQVRRRRRPGRAVHRRVPARPLPEPEVADRGRRRQLRELNEALLRVPDGFTVHPKLVKQLDRRRQALGDDGGIDWAHAEQLAYASLLTEGDPVRLTGQDAERGTFSQRHLVLHDAKTGQTHLPDPAPARARPPRSSCTTRR